MAISVRTRFEIFKRDGFTCMYCGWKSPEVILEVDHIIPLCDGGTDDPINLRTSCWECNRGKSRVPLNDVLPAEDPHDRAILLLERERQLAEYNSVLRAIAEDRERDTWELVRYWQLELGEISERTENLSIDRHDFNWLKCALEWCPKEQLRYFMDLAINRRMTSNFRYVAGCARNWRYDQQATTDMHGKEGGR